MAYTPPAGNAVDFTLADGAYSIPLGGEVAFFFQEVATPTVSIVGASTLSMRGEVSLSGAFNVNAASGANFEHPYREFSIAGESRPEFVTWQRRFEILTSAQASFRAGVTARIAGSSGADLDLWGVLQSAVATEGSKTTAAFDCFWYHNGSFSVANSKTTARGKSGYTKPIGFSVKSGSAVAAYSSSHVMGAFLANAESRFAGEWVALKASEVNVGGASRFDPVWKAYGAATVAFSAGSSAEFFGQQGGLGSVAFPAGTTIAFASQSASAALRDQADYLLSVRAVPIRIYALTQS